MMMRIRVDFPAPLGPTRPRTRPRGRSRSTSLSANPGYLFPTPRSRTACSLTATSDPSSRGIAPGRAEVTRYPLPMAGDKPGWRAIVFWNVVVFLALASVAALGGEAYFRWIYDSTDSFGLTLTTQRWLDRHFKVNQSGVRDSLAVYDDALPRGKRRVTFTGDSFTAGWGVADVEDRFANRIRKDR